MFQLSLSREPDKLERPDPLDRRERLALRVHKVKPARLAVRQGLQVLMAPRVRPGLKASPDHKESRVLQDQLALLGHMVRLVHKAPLDPKVLQVFKGRKVTRVLLVLLAP